MIKKVTLIKAAATTGLVSTFAIGAQYSNPNIFTPQTVETSSKIKVKLTQLNIYSK